MGNSFTRLRISSSGATPSPFAAYRLDRALGHLEAAVGRHLTGRPPPRCLARSASSGRLGTSPPADARPPAGRRRRARPCRRPRPPAMLSASDEARPVLAASGPALADLGQGERPVDRVPAGEQVLVRLARTGTAPRCGTCPWPGCTGPRTGSPAAGGPGRAAGRGWRAAPCWRPGRAAGWRRAGPGCRGGASSANSSRTSAVSTTRPAYMTLTRSACPAITPMSWVISSMAMPSRSFRSPEQGEDLRLDGDVERRGRLVGDEQLGLVGQRHGDHHALPQAAGQLVRVVARAAPSAGAARPGPAPRPPGRAPRPCVAPRCSRTGSATW